MVATNLKFDMINDGAQQTRSILLGVLTYTFLVSLTVFFYIYVSYPMGVGPSTYIQVLISICFPNEKTIYLV